MKNSQKKVRAKGALGVYFRDSESKRFRGKPDRCFYIAFRNNENKLVWEKVGWKSEGYTVAMASNLRAERVRALRHGEELPKRKKKAVTLGEIWEKYYKWLETNATRTGDDRSRYSLHLKPRFADKSLADITPFDLEKLKSDLFKDGKAPATVKHVLALVRQIYNKAKAWGLYKGENPVKSVKLPKLNNKRERFLTHQEAHILLQELEKVSPQLADMALLSLHTGMRAGEIFNLKWGHIDMTLKLIHVANPKSGFSRKAFMTEAVKSMFQTLKPGQPEELVFKARSGGPVKEVSNSFERVIKKLGWNAGIKDSRHRVTFHTLRHTFASWLAIQGTHILMIKELMGHQSLAMTERYSHLIPDVKQEAVRKLETAFQAGQKLVHDVSQKIPQA